MRPIDGDRLMMHLTDWWYSSFGQAETDESKAIKSVLDKIEQSLGVFALEKQEADGWIPVTERLPEENGTYLACYEDATVLLDWFNGKWFFYRTNPAVEETGTIIAWRPLPEAYTEEDNDKP